MQLTRLLHIRNPIIQGSMARISTPALVIAVSEAGGLGVLTTTGATAASLQQNLKTIRAATKKSFGVNLMLQQPNIAELLPVLQADPVPVVFTSAGNPAPFMKELLGLGTKVIPVIPNVKIAKKMAALGASAIIAEGLNPVVISGLKPRWRWYRKLLQRSLFQSLLLVVSGLLLG